MSALKKQNECYDVSTHYDFGENWADYAQHLTPKKIQIAEENLLRLIAADALKGKTFLDIGCGSGLHSLAALKAGVAYATCVDFDANSVQTTRAVLARHWPQQNYSVEEFNILSSQSAAALSKNQFDVVYSWGVLHHTGDMWSAIKQASAFVKPKGLFVIALYKKTPSCGFWKKEKAFYTKASKPVRKLCDWFYALLYCGGLLASGRNPITYVREYEGHRGMRFMNDVSDWLGGYPYESATPEETQAFVENLGFKLVQMHNTRPTTAHGLFGTGCAEYVFVRQ